MEFLTSKQRSEIVEKYSSFAATGRASAPGTPGFDRAKLKALADLGLLSFLEERDDPSPRQGLAPLTLALETLGAGGLDRGFLFGLGAHLFGCQNPISVHATNEKHKAWVRKLAAGEALGALAVTEPQGGSNLAQMKTMATRSDGHFILDGSKTLITNAPTADVFLVLAVTAPERGGFGWSAFAVERSAPGLEIGELASIGMPGAPVGKLNFSNCRIDADCLVGSFNGGQAVFNTAMAYERIGILAGLLGATASELGRCIDFVRKRFDTGEGAKVPQAVSHRLARCTLKIERSRLLLQRAAWIFDKKEKNGYQAAAMAKLDASETLFEIATDILKTKAGHAWLGDDDAGSSLIDALGSLFASGTPEIQLSIIATTLGLRS